MSPFASRKARPFAERKATFRHTPDLTHQCQTMSIRISNLRLGLDEPEAALQERLARVLGLSTQSLGSWRILRKSLDARVKDALHFVYTAEVDAADDEDRLAALARRAGIAISHRPARGAAVRHAAATARDRSQHRPVVVGSGPAGWWRPTSWPSRAIGRWSSSAAGPCASASATSSASTPAGRFDPESNYLFGEGGAGTFSDGKLTCRGTGPDVRRVLELFAECKGKPSILYEHRPHLGSNRLPAVVKAIRRRIEALGGEVRFSCRVEDLDLADGRLRGADHVVGLHPRRRWRCWRSATAPATPTRCSAPRRADGARSRFRSACASSSRRRSSTASSTAPRRLEEKLGRGRLHPGRARPARPVHLLHVRRRLHHAQRVRGRATSAPTA